MKAWYIIGIVMALIPLYFRNRRLAEPNGTAGLSAQTPSVGRRVMWFLFLGALAVLVYAWTATPPLPE